MSASGQRAMEREPVAYPNNPIRLWTKDNRLHHEPKPEPALSSRSDISFRNRYYREAPNSMTW